MFAGNLDPQWDRYAKVVFQNFDTGLNTTIDSLRIQAKYTKTIDESRDSSNGEIKIYGLTEKTFNAIGERLRTEVELHAGYLKSKANTPRQLFKAVLMDKSYEIVDGNSVSTFVVLGDFVRKNIGFKISKTFAPNDFILELLGYLADQMNLSLEFRIKVHEKQDLIAEFLEKYRLPFGYVLHGTPKQALKRLCDSYGFEYTIDSDSVNVTIRDDWMPFYVDRASTALTPVAPPVIKAAENKVGTTIQNSPTNAVSNIKAPTFDELNKSMAIFLSNDTGLIGTPKIKTIEAAVAYDQALREGEDLKSQKMPRARVDKKGELIRDKVTNEVKMTKTPKTKSVFRRQVEARMYINASVVPQVHVTLSTTTGVTDGTYKVRALEITLDTEGDDWFMDLILNE